MPRSNEKANNHSNDSHESFVVVPIAPDGERENNENNESIANEDTLLLPDRTQPASNADLIPLLIKFLPVAATSLFSAASNFKNPEQAALIGCIGVSTILPFLAEVKKICWGLSDRANQWIESLSGMLMCAAVGLMGMGAIKTYNKSLNATVGLAAMALFSFFALLNMGYQVAKLLGCVSGEHPRVALASNGAGFIGSLLFLATQALNFMSAHKEQNQDEMKASGFIGGAAIGFIGATGYGLFQARRAVQAAAANTQSVLINADDTDSGVYGAA